MPAASDEAEILVVGTGLAGLLAALAFKEFSVTLVGPDPRLDDRRTTALMNPALDLLDRVGILTRIEGAAAPLKTMRIVDATSRLVRSQPVTFRSSEIGEERFGLNIPNGVLLNACVAAITDRPSIKWLRTTVTGWTLGDETAIAELADANSVRARLVIAADGRTSPAREAAGIRADMREYPQSALVLNFSHTRPHDFISTEFQTESGPFTQVPMPGKTSSLVWVERPDIAKALADLDDATLAERVEGRMQSMLGRVTVLPGRQLYPLSTMAPSRLARNRVMLVGEAAHVFPPIGAQGLNLGIRDIEDAVSIAGTHRADPGSSLAMVAYDRRRRPDVLARSVAINLLNRSLLSDMLPAQFARGAGLGLLGGFGPVRSFFMQEGLRPGSGFGRIFGDLGKKVGRQQA